MLVRGHNNAEPRTGINVDMRIDAALADELQPGQAFQERRPDRCAFANQHQRLGVGEAARECIDILDVVVPDGNVMAIELAEARQRAYGVMVVVQDGDFHEMPSSSRKDAQSIRLNPGVSSGGFPLWRGRPKPSIIFRRNGRDRTGLRLFDLNGLPYRGGREWRKIVWDDAGIEMRWHGEVSLQCSVRRKAMVVRRAHVNVKFACDGCRLAQ